VFGKLDCDRESILETTEKTSISIGRNVFKVGLKGELRES
jgi:hypothetical protein